MPGEDGLTLAREIRASSDVGIIMLTGRDDVLDRIVGLEVGADDYIAKPFHLREVLARVKSVLRRREPPTMPSGTADEVIRFEGWRLDVVRRQLVSPTGEDVALTSGEFDLLAALARASRPRLRPRSADGFDARSKLGGLRPHHRRASRPPQKKNRSRPEKSDAGEIGSQRGLRLHRESRSIA